jgi:hypothetical protein
MSMTDPIARHVDGYRIRNAAQADMLVRIKQTAESASRR